MLRKILNTIYDRIYIGISKGIPPNIVRTDIDQALSQIIDTIIEGLPKEKQGIKFHSGRQNTDIGAYSPADNRKVGYNQCLSDLKTKLEKMKGEE